MVYFVVFIGIALLIGPILWLRTDRVDPSKLAKMSQNQHSADTIEDDEYKNSSKE